MGFNLKKVFGRYFPSPFEMFMTGTACLILSFPGIGMIFVRHDAVFPQMFDSLRKIGVAWGCATLLVGIILVFCGFRSSAAAGTITYRLTHPGLPRRDRWTPPG